MYGKNCNISDLWTALKAVNEKYDGNIVFNREPTPTNKGICFTLKCRDSKKAGHRRGFNLEGGKGRRLISACWHVHGHFFEELFKVCPEAMVISRGKKITAESGNWEDENIGSQIQPLCFSEACDCIKGVR